jgi:hypothetical protein
MLCSLGTVSAGEPRCEIEHLLTFIGKSQCSFIRNGEAHDSADARAHIQRKYDYAKRWIETSEQFIEYTATRSSTTNRAYSVICKGREEPSADWLTRELERLRAESACE